MTDIAIRIRIARSGAGGNNCLAGLAEYMFNFLRQVRVLIRLKPTTVALENGDFLFKKKDYSVYRATHLHSFIHHTFTG